MKGLSASVYQTIAAYYEGAFPGGVTTVKDASNNGVALPMETSKLVNFTQEDYDALFAKLANNEIVIPNDTTAAAADQLTLEVVKVTLY
jgi:basic membrane protein A